MSPSRRTEDLRAIAERAAAVFEADQRVAAAWLEGSLAAGTADPASDIDLHVAIRDEHFDAVMQERHSLIGQIAPILGYGENPVPTGFLVYANLEGMWRIDVVFTRESDAGRAAVRHIKALFDKSGVTSGLRLRPEAEDLRPLVERLVRELSFGCFQPLRLWGRHEWGSLDLALHFQLFSNVVPAWLAVEDPANAFRPQFHNERFLSPSRRSEIESLLVLAREAYAGREPDPDRLRAVWEREFAMNFAAVKAACERWGVGYPQDVEDAVRQTYRAELGFEVPPIAWSA